MNKIKRSKYQSDFKKTGCVIGAVLFLLAGYSTSVMASSSDVTSYNASIIKNEGTAAYADTSKVYQVVEQMPEIKGGLQAVYKNIDYPQEAINQGIEGRVYITFVVDENGNIRNPKVLRGIGGGCGQAAIEALKDVEFKPGRRKGKAVKVKFSLPITFELE